MAKSPQRKPGNNLSQGKTGKKDNHFPIVAIGASAGGIEAATEFFTNLSPDLGMAFVYLQHLDPDHESKLSQTIGRHSKMKVVEAKNSLKLAPNNVYVLPPNKVMTINDGVFNLVNREPRPASHMPINTFFTSLADNHTSGAIGIILSGTSNDGAIGLKAIKTAGGITFVQDQSARFQGMPTAAIAEDAVDHILPPAAIAKELEHISKNIHLLLVAFSKEPLPEEESQKDIDAILQLIRKSTGTDFSNYKKNTIQRRVVRRMLLQKLENLSQYLQYLKAHTAEIALLHRDLLINVTSFFRDKESTEYLKKVIIPKIVSNKKLSDPIRIWVPACSTGEEAYSLAFMIMECLGDMANQKPIQIFATDLSEYAIIKARQGLYSKQDIANLSPKRLQQFFTKVDGSYRVSRQIRDMCVFAPHNILKDPPFSRIDLISCCNLLIYLELNLQKKILSTFHYALNESGYLLLGKSETIGTLSNLFNAEHKKIRIYSWKRENNPLKLERTFRIRHSDQERTHLKNPSDDVPVAPVEKKRDLDSEINALLLAEFVPPSVVINAEMEIIQFRGSTGNYLEPSPGKASFNILKMAKPGLNLELRRLIHKVLKTNKRQRTNVEFQNGTQHVTLEAFPVPTLTAEKNILILFIGAEHQPEPGKTSKNADNQVKQLKIELETTLEDMRSIIEEQEAVNEELQIANEEIVSSNEELQSINEELETSKEEVESMNEELMTMNQEMQNRNEQLSEAYDYAEGVFTTIREAVIVLTKDLTVKTANTVFYSMFNCTEAEIEGRYFYELNNREWDLPSMHELLERKLPQQGLVNNFKFEKTLSANETKTFLLNARIIYQKALNQNVILLAIEDITEQIRAEQVIKERAAWFKNMADNAPVMIWMINEDKVPVFYNKTWLEFTGRTSKKELTASWFDGIYPQDMARVIENFEMCFEQRKPCIIEYRRKRNDGQYRWLLSESRPSYDINGSFVGFVGSCSDIHDRIEFDNIQKESTDKLILVLNRLPLMAWMSDADGNLNFVNDWYTQYTGMSLKDINRLGKQSVLHPDDYKPFMEVWSAHLKTGFPIDIKVRYLENVTGEYRWHVVRALPVRIADGTITGWIGTNTDIHDQFIFTEELDYQVKERTLALQETNLRLERSNIELQQFAYAASHDLQEPLRKIITFADRLTRSCKEAISGKGEVYLEKIVESAQRMRELIDSILNFSKVGADQIFEAVDLNEIVEKSIKDQEILISEKAAEITVQNLTDVIGVPILLQQVFSNLINNALKFTKKDVTPRIEITCERITKKEADKFPELNTKKAYIRISISDNGVGFEEKYAEKIFSLFQRLDSRIGQGTGIGLALCKKIVAFHGGHIYAESKLNVGSIFHIFLPVEKEIKKKLA